MGVNLNVCSSKEYRRNVLKRKAHEPLEKRATTGRNGYVPQWLSQLTNFHSLCRHVLCWALGRWQAVYSVSFPCKGSFLKELSTKVNRMQETTEWVAQCAGQITARHHPPLSLRVRVDLNQPTWGLFAEQNTFSVWAKLEWPCVQRTQRINISTSPSFFF